MHLVAFNDCGIELRCPNLVTRQKRVHPMDLTPSISADPANLRHHAWDEKEVLVAFGALDPEWAYELGVTYVCELGQRRIQSLYVNEVKVDGPRSLPPDEIVRVRVPIPRELIGNGRIDVRVVPDEGPDALLTEIALWSDHVAPLTVTVVGDAAGGLFGTVSDVDFGPVRDAEISVKWGDGSASTSTDEDGVFELPIRTLLGEGRRSVLDVSATRGDRHGAVSVDSVTLSLGLNDVPANGIVDLTGVWSVAPGIDQGMINGFVDPTCATATVPGHLAFDDVDTENGVSTLRRDLVIPETWLGGRVAIRFDGAYSLAEVYVNGEFVGSHQGGATSFEVDATDVVRAGSNDLCVVLTEFTAASVIDYMSWYAHMSLAGIWRKVYAYVSPRAHFGSARISGDLVELGVGLVDASIPIVNSTDAPQQYSLAWSLHGPDGSGTASCASPVTGLVGPRDREVVRVPIRVEGVIPWSAEAPALYLLRLSLTTDRTQVVEHQVGFRTVEVSGNSILINGKAVRLLGVNRHDSRRMKGRALSAQDMRHDVTTLRQANVNTVRTSHYPPAPEFLDLSDALGMYVLDQPPICWAGTYKWDMSHVDAHTLPHVWQVIAETFERDRNHPSVVVWDVANESAWGRNFEVCLRRLRERDRSRPTLFSFDAPLQGTPRSSALLAGPDRPDLRSNHYPGWTQPWRNDLARFAQFDEPVLCDEFMPIFQVCQREPHEAYALRLDPGLRDYWVTGYGPFAEEFFATRSCVGGMVWSAVDDVFQVPRAHTIGRGAWSHLPEHEFLQPYEFVETESGWIRGDGEWGLLDSWGRPRPELWHLQKIYSPILVVHSAWLSSRTLRVLVRNRFAHMSFHDIRVSALTDRGRLEVSLNARPSEEELFELDLDEIPGGGDASEVTLEFVHQEGWLIDAFTWGVPGRPDRRSSDRWLVQASGRSALSAAGNLEVGQGLVSSWPWMHAMDADTALVPTISVTHAEVGARNAAGEVDITAWAEGDGWQGRYVVTDQSDGVTRVAYDFTYQGSPFLARELGIAIPTASGLSTLWWDRDAEWSYYPQDHIGRAQGRAPSHASGAMAHGPDQAWEADTTQAGSNDFRSAKRNIRAAGLTDGERGVAIVSDGTQHVRAVVRDGQPILHVLDWYGGVRTADSEAGVWSAYFGPGMSIETGMRVTGTVLLLTGSITGSNP